MPRSSDKFVLWMTQSIQCMEKHIEAKKMLEVDTEIAYKRQITKLDELWRFVLAWCVWQFFFQVDEVQEEKDLLGNWNPYAWKILWNLNKALMFRITIELWYALYHTNDIASTSPH